MAEDRNENTRRRFLLGSLQSALIFAEHMEDLDTKVVIEALLEHLEAGTVGELARMIEQHRKPLETAAPTPIVEDWDVAPSMRTDTRLP